MGYNDCPFNHSYIISEHMSCVLSRDLSVFDCNLNLFESGLSLLSDYEWYVIPGISVAHQEMYFRDGAT